MGACGLFFKSYVLSHFLCAMLFFHEACASESVPVEFLMPDNHPIKPLLDALFSTCRVLLNLDNLKKVGFDYAKPRKFTNLIIAKHPALPGYIFKLYLDAQRYHKDKPEQHFWKLRVQGARLVRQEIEKYHLQDLMKVPLKWIYQLPKRPIPPKGYVTKHYILVEEDMQLLSKEENEKIWASTYVTPQHLHAVCLVLRNVGLCDCAKPDNMPFSIDGRIAFIDTQTHGEEVNCNNLTAWLSAENQAYWELLITP